MTESEEISDPWAHRSAAMKCATCMWYAIKTSSPALGRCRRHAPTMNGYPVIFSVDWCGDHKLDETKLQPVLISKNAVVQKCSGD